MSPLNLFFKNNFERILQHVLLYDVTPITCRGIREEGKAPLRDLFFLTVERRFRYLVAQVLEVNNISLRFKSSGSNYTN